MNEFWSKINFDKILEFLKLKKFNVTYKEIKNSILIDQGIKLSIFSVKKILIDTFGLTYRKINLKSIYLETKQFFEERYIFIKLFINFYFNNKIIIYTDESQFNFKYKNFRQLNNSKNSIISNNLEKKPMKSLNKNDNFNGFQLILSCTKDKIIFFKIFEGINNSLTFKSYLEDLLKFIDENKIEGDLVFFFDNTPVHDNKIIYEFFKERKMEVLWAVNNYSELDFCEIVFRCLKNEHYRKIYKTTY